MKLSASHYRELIESLLDAGQPVTARVAGSSMLPAIPGDSVVRFVPIGGQVPQVGQVVLLRRGDGHLICHRIIKISKRSQAAWWVRTWGDGCWLPDEAVPVANVLAVVTGLGEGGGEKVPPGPPLWRLVCRHVRVTLLRHWKHRAEVMSCGPEDPSGG